MASQPFTEVQIWDEINAAAQRMSPEQARMWECAKIIPEKWSEPRYGAAQKGFWAVAVMGRTVVWYDDIEDGFVVSECAHFGTIAGYTSGDTGLEGAMQKLINRLSSVPTTPWALRAPKRTPRSSITTRNAGPASRRSRQARRPASTHAAGIDAASMARRCQSQAKKSRRFLTTPAQPAAARNRGQREASGLPNTAAAQQRPAQSVAHRK
jgi:hypothetical protein